MLLDHESAHRIPDWFGLGRHLKTHLVPTLPWAGTLGALELFLLVKSKPALELMKDLFRVASIKIMIVAGLKGAEQKPGTF